ncbi:hypothetical protein B0T10DRAFT_406646 [Thelonectria olida]|uniref:Uncharacterized protein n=1 Tax=Thelonectria olida TaxID=1576542 RepID=A0A9P8W133_9HYPO|nr:hypothetical protein B0T10DRAFT_406646 [Thelonectria olida]
MFLHSGASLHGHEYSTSRQSPHQQNHPARLPFLRSALRRPSDPDVRPTVAAVAPPSQEPPPAAPAAPVTSRPLSYHEHAPAAPRTSRPRPTSDYMPRRELSVRFREPETDDELPTPTAEQSEDDSSIAYQSDASEASDCSSSTRKKRMRRKRAPRKSTQFLLAHPAPRIRPKQRKLAQRPRLLLQLQDLTEKRPNPAFDILPSSLAIGSLIMPRLAKRCPSLFRAKPILGLNDLLFVRSEDYEAPATPGSHDADDCLDQRDVISIISPLPHMGDDACEIVMEDGSTWESSLMANDSYEFIGVDERGRISTARWVKKAASSAPLSHLRTASTGTSTPPSSPAPQEFKWTFSMIHPDTRRHPIMGTLQSNALDVFHTYNTMSASSGRYPPTRPSPMDTNGAPDWHGAKPTEGRVTKTVPEDIKLLMVVTAAWIHLRQEGWPATAATRPPPATLQRRPPQGNAFPFPQKAQTFPVRSSASSMINQPHIPARDTASPAPSTRSQREISPETGRRRSMSSSGFVKRFVAPRASEDGARRPTVETIYNEAEKASEKTADRPAGRRMSVRQIANRIFRRKSVSQAQTDEPFYKLEY